MGLELVSVRTCEACTYAQRADFCATCKHNAEAQRTWAEEIRSLEADKGRLAGQLDRWRLIAQKLWELAINEAKQ